MDDNNNKKIIDRETRKKANRYFFGKIGVNVLLLILGAVFIAIFLRQMQSQASIAKQQQSSSLALQEVVASLEENKEEADTLGQIFHDSNQDLLNDMNKLFSTGLFVSLGELDNKTRSEVFADMIERSGVEYLFMLDMEGNVVLSSSPELYRVNPAARALMTQENVNDILKGTVNKDGTITPVVVGNQYGSYYFYSTPYKYKGNKYCLVLGADASVLDVQINSLKDVSVVLSRAAVDNNGFLFAVNTDDGTFQYFVNGDEILTGQSAIALGLSEDALNDGYSGIQTIKGTRYFCVSKSFGDQTVICAVAAADNIIANDKYVLFWTIMGFILVMLICLAYAIVVRNDFVRRAVQTERITLNPHSDNPTYFDKSIFKKVFPLMIAGVLLMYGISFYTQTLLEITGGIHKSNIALDEVAGRYEESLESRDVIQNYYNNRFLSKARLLAFLLEEDPSALNEESSHYHSVYDKDGSRTFLKDSEGNMIKSVASSEKLQELCDANDIDAIYVFDEDGHTIGTNTPDWYFTVSRNEEDQSYPFLQVLDGRKDSFVQDPMTNDLGEANQYIGVGYTYYTSTDKNGNTVYVPRVDYDLVQRTGKDRAGNERDIEVHHSMMQIGLDATMTQKLLDSTEVGNILSTNMLNGGFIVMFDTSEDHLCVYSPKESSIGKSAEELGVSPKAFSGDDYYGFNTVNGVTYFQYFHYNDGYYIATALPRSEMYQSRGIISLITALMSFLLILILSGTVTLTNKEEEDMYEAMTEEEAGKGFNSAIFHIVLPSGRSSVTTRAVARWDNRRIPWRERSPEQKLISMVSIVMGILMVYVIIIVLGANTIFEEGSIIHYILNGAWDRGRNIFALSSCGLVIITIYLGVLLFRIPVRITTALLGARGETIGHLLLSVVKYGGVLFGIFYCLYLLGIDSSRLLASAGILSLIIGLGAQSLIKDIIAGIFIVFEGEFRVGDIVTINDYRGTVMDIGLRTTKILGPDGNIKIYNNSDIAGVLNMTQEISLAISTISIEYGQDIEYVEAVLARELPKLKEQNPKILTGPDYLGVLKLADSGVELIVTCNCSESDIRQVTRDLNRGLLQIFYKNGINIPFPNVTFSALKTEGRMSIEDLVRKMKEESEEGSAENAEDKEDKDAQPEQNEE